MITLHKLKLFIVDYDRGSFNQVAQELYLAQSAVSQHIQSLETALGTPLFERSPQGVRPTKAGDLLYDYSRRILRLLAEAERAIMQIDQAQRHKLVVGATPGISVYLLPVWLQQFQVVHTTTRVSMQTVLTADLVRDCLNGHYNFGFLEGELHELDQEGPGRLRLRDLDYRTIVSPQHPWAGKSTVDLSELSDQPFINRQPASRTRRWLDQILHTRSVQLYNVAELDSPGAIKYALLNNMGIAILPLYAVEREIERGDLFPVQLMGLELKRPLMLVWNKHQPFSSIQRAFISLLANDAPQLQILLLASANRHR
jgi:DNA-binding transcriptional LysR family regulator